MSFTTAYDATKPAGSRALNLGDDDIREFKVQFQERMNVDHHMPSAGDDANTGYHEKVTLIEQASDPSQLANTLLLYAKQVGSYSELYSRHENAALQQLTLNGKLWASALSIASVAQGDILFFDGTIFNRLAASTSGFFLKTQGAGANPLWAALPASYTNGQAKNIAVVRTSASVVTLTADEIVVDDGAGAVQRFTSINLTADITVSGAGGLDAGGGAANTIYYLWFIAKTDGTKNLLLSTSATSPTMPSGYTYKTLLSCVGNNNSSSFIAFHQNGRLYEFDAWADMHQGNGSLASWESVDLTPANMTTNPGFVPSALSDACFGSFYGDSGLSAFVTNDSSVATSTTVARNKLGALSAGTPSFWRFKVLTADTLYHMADNVGDIMYLAGFEINKLGF